MKIGGVKIFGIALCVALAAILSWSALPTNAEGDACPLKAAKAAKDGEACAAKASVAKSEKSGECCEAGAKPAVAKAEKGECCEAGAKPAVAKAEKGECCESGAKPAVAEKGACDSAKPAVALTADGKGECPLAAAAKVAEAKGECTDAAKGECADAAAAKGECAQTAAKVAKGECAEGACDGKGKDIAKLVASDSRFTTLALAAKAAGVAEVFSCPKQKTVFAPTNEAFQKIPAEQWAALLQDDAKLKALLANHVVTENAIEACQIKETKTAKASGGCDLAFSTCPQSGTVSINGAKVVGEALVASNGVIHAIDTVLVPADMELAKVPEADAIQVAASE